MDEPRSAVLTPAFEEVQAHYDLSDDFFALFLDRTRTYSCAKFDTPQSTLEEAQLAKIDLSLGKCDLKAGQVLLDIGCGWGATALRARQRHNVRVIGLTLSKNQHAYCQGVAGGDEGLEFRLEGWETFNQKVDRIVSIGAFEHFKREKYPAFFARCHEILPEDGMMLLHTITRGKPSKTMAFMRFAHFMTVKIFPGGDVPAPEAVVEASRNGNFELVHAESLRPHYAKTLDCWAANLSANEKKAVEIAGEQIYKMYMKYLTSCANFFRSGEVNVYQFKLRKI